MIIEKNKNTFEDLLGLEIETQDKFLNKKLNSNVCYMGGGGGGQKQQDIAPTLRPFVTDVLSRAKGVFGEDVQFEKYPGERVVGFTKTEQDAFRGIKDLVDRGVSSDKTLSDASTYYDPALGLLGDVEGFTKSGAAEITADEIQSRMNPYTQAVLDIAKRKAADEGALYRQQLASQAARTGGFGGSRQAILEAKAASDLGGRLSEIQTKGMEAAYNDAIRAAEAARGRQFQAAQGLGALSGQYGNLGQQALGQAYREMGYKSGIGEQVRDLRQRRADVAYGDFQQEREFPMQQLERYAGIAFGVPRGYIQPTSPTPSAFQQGVQGIAGGVGIGKRLGFFNQGGDIGDGGLSTVYRQSGSTVRPAGPLASFTLDDLKKYLDETRYDKDREMKKLEEQRQDAIATAIEGFGQGVGQADPRLGLLGLFGQGASGATEGLSKMSDIDALIESLPDAERKALIDDYLIVSSLEKEEAEKRYKEAAAASEKADDILPSAAYRNIDNEVAKLYGAKVSADGKFTTIAGVPLDAKSAAQMQLDMARAAKFAEQQYLTDPKAFYGNTLDFISKNLGFQGAMNRTTP